jgi:hypothetical protein
MPPQFIAPWLFLSHGNVVMNLGFERESHFVGTLVEQRRPMSRARKSGTFCEILCKAISTREFALLRRVPKYFLLFHPKHGNNFNWSNP